MQTTATTTSEYGINYIYSILTYNTTIYNKFVVKFFVTIVKKSTQYQPCSIRWGYTVPDCDRSRVIVE